MTTRPWETTLCLTKGGAAERHFQQAVRLFFERGDPVSIYTLASAAVQVFSDLLEDVGAGGLTRNRHIIVDGRFKEWIDANKRDENFFKHADRDPNGTLQFDTIKTVLMLIEAAVLVERVTSSVSKESRLLLIWAMKAYPDFFRLRPSDSAIMSLFDADDFHTIRAALDDRDGRIAHAMRDFQPPLGPGTPYDIFLNKT